MCDNVIVDEKIRLAQDLIDKITRDFIKIDGAKKVKSNILQELNFLKKLKKENDENAALKLKCTNLIFYSHLVNSLYRYGENNNKILGILKSVGEDKKLLVHLICDTGNSEQLWVKIIARDPDAILDEITNAGFGQKNIIEVAENFQDYAMNSRSYRPPKIIFDFLHQINEELEILLEEKGVIIGRKYLLSMANNNHLDITQNILNIDITTMIAYCSELSNGGTKTVFNDKFLDMQAEEERENPIVPVIDSIVRGKKLIACETAVNSFKDIINILGGVNERKRASEFLAKLEVLSDVDDVQSVLNAELTSHIKERSRKIFAFGVYQSAVTVTSNFGFARAIKNQSLDIPMIFHSARALTEMKENEINSAK